LTDDGAERLERASELHLESIRELFCERFSSDELAVLASLLDRLQGSSSVDGDAVESP
jgi:hypothetical protein